MGKGIAVGFLGGFLLLMGFSHSAAAQTSGLETTATDINTVLKSFSSLEAGQENMILSASGLPQSKDFDLAKLIAYFLFPGIGFVIFVFGKKNAEAWPMVVGIVLMAYTYFVSATWAIYLIGIGLIALLYFWRE